MGGIQSTRERRGRSGEQASVDVESLVDGATVQWDIQTGRMNLRERLTFYQRERERVNPCENIPLRQTGFREELEARLKERISRCTKQISDSRRVLDRAMSSGAVKLSNTNVLILGMAGTGKTSTKHLLFDMPPPAVRNSTLLAEVPIRAQIPNIQHVHTSVRDMKGGLVHLDESQWVIVRNNTFVEQLVTGRSPKPNSPRCRSRVFTTGSVRVRVDTLIDSHCQQGEESTDVKIDRCVKKFLQKMEVKIEQCTETDEDSVSVIGSNWRLYFIDSGGQPQFHNLLPHFIKGMSVVLFTHRLCDKLDVYHVIDYYDGDKCIGTHRSTLTTKETLKYLMRSMQSYTDCKAKPKVIIIGTFLDKIKDSTETLDVKNQQLLELLSPECLDQLVFHNEAMNQLIFPINAKNPGMNENRIAELIRAAIQSSSPPPVSVPTWWYVLQVILEDLSTHLSRKVLSRNECLEVAEKLNFGKEELTDALNYLHERHLIHYYQDILPDVVFASPQVLLDKLTELVKEAYRLRESRLDWSKPPTAVRTGNWQLFRDKGIITPSFLRQEQFKQHFVDGIFTASDLVKIFSELLIVTPIESSLGGVTALRKQFYMPSLLNTVSSADVERYRIFSSVEPLLISFPSGSIRSGVFCSLQVYLIQQLKWKLVHTDGKPEVIAQNCVILSHPDMPCIVTLIDSFSCLEVHVEAGFSVCKRLCSSIYENILGAIQALNQTFRYSNENPEMAFFCKCTPSSSSSGPEQRHIAYLLRSRGWIQCSVRQRNQWKITPKHGVWLGISTTSREASSLATTILCIETHLWPIRTAVHEARARWRDIGRAFGVSEGTIESIHNSDDGECLHKVLMTWMEPGRATIYDLLEALEHKVVGCEGIAEEIRRFEGEERVNVGL